MLRVMIQLEHIPCIYVVLPSQYIIHSLAVIYRTLNLVYFAKAKSTESV